MRERALFLYSGFLLYFGRHVTVFFYLSRRTLFQSFHFERELSGRDVRRNHRDPRSSQIPPAGEPTPGVQRPGGVTSSGGSRRRGRETERELPSSSPSASSTQRRPRGVGVRRAIPGRVRDPVPPVPWESSDSDVYVPDAPSNRSTN